MSEPSKCRGGCGKTLRSEKSIARGLGPVCWRKLHGHPARRPRAISPPAAAPGQGQDELPLNDQLDLFN